MADQSQLLIHPDRLQFVDVRLFREIGYARSFRLLFGVGLARWLFLHLMSAILSFVLLMAVIADNGGSDMSEDAGSEATIIIVLPFYAVR
jgi:hypothetical protein